MQIRGATTTLIVASTLAPLGAESAETLLAALLGDATELEPLRALVRRHTDGNPFFIEETVRALAESGALAGSAAPTGSSAQSSTSRFPPPPRRFSPRASTA